MSTKRETLRKPQPASHRQGGPQMQHGFGNRGSRVQDVPAVPRGGGGVTPEAPRSFFEPRFGHDFGRVRVHTGVGAAQPARPFVLQRKCACGNQAVSGMECEACSTRNALQRQAGNRSNASAVPPVVYDVLRLPGQPLNSAMRDFMEPRFGRDFGVVRVHDDAKAAESAQAVNALAYTVGHHIVFGAGQYASGSSAARQTLAHELTHVIQQERASQHLPDKLEITEQHEPTEKEADAASKAILTGDGMLATQTGKLKLSRQDLESGTGADVSGGASGSAGGAVPMTGPDAGTPALPTVSLGNFRNSGSTDSENNCPLCPKTLGVSSSEGVNVMEIRGDVTGHVATAQYDIKRTKERATWKKVGSSWTQQTRVGPGADDDSHNDDEDLTPQNNHIFVIDSPGWAGSISNPTGDSAATEAVYKASFVETCNVKVGSGSWTASSNSLAWHSITWLQKKSDGTWERKAGSSEIATGSITVGTGDP